MDQDTTPRTVTPPLAERPYEGQPAGTPTVGRTPAPRRRRGGGILLWLVLIAVVVGLVLWHPWRAGKQVAAATPPQPVVVATAARANVPVVYTELGTVTPLATVTVQSQISGYLTEVLFKEGQDVKKGDLLALVDPRPYEVSLEQYQAQLERDQAALAQAKMDLARYQTLGRQNSIAKQTLEDQVFTVAQDQGTVKADQAEVDTQKLDLAYCHIQSPVDGRVGLRQIDAGNYVTASSTTGLVVVTEIKPISVIFTVSEDDIQPILEQMNGGAKLSVDAYDRTDTTKIATGTVETIDNQVDTSTGTVKLRADFPNADERLFPNEFVNAHLLLKTLDNVLVVPTAAIQSGPQGSFVYLVEPVGSATTGTTTGAGTPAGSGTTEDTASPTGTSGTGTSETGSATTGPNAATEAGTGTTAGHQRHARALPADGKVVVRVVKTGVTDGLQTVIVSGLAVGDRVVTDGTDRLHAGATITIPADHAHAKAGAASGPPENAPEQAAPKQP